MQHHHRHLARRWLGGFASGRQRYILTATLGYAVFATAWIFLSDQLLAEFADLSRITWLSTAKGIAFVAVTSLLLFVGLHNVPPEQGTADLADAPLRFSPLRLAAAIAIPLSAFAVQWAFWDFFEPYGWMLLSPAVFFSAWISGLAGGLLGTVLATLLGWYAFVPAYHSFALERPTAAVSIGIFFGMGTLFSLTLQRLRTVERHAAQAMFRGLVEQSLAGIYLIQDGRFRYVNQGFADIFGYAAPADIVGRLAVAELVAPRDRALVAGNIRRRIEGEVGDMRYSFTGLRRDGSEIGVEVHGRVIEHDGRPAVIGILMDISERLRAEAALRQKAAMQEQLTGIAASVPGVIYAFVRAADGSTRFDYASPAIERIFGISADLLLQDATPLYRMLHPDDAKPFLASLERSARQLSPWHMEFRYRHPQRGLVWVEASSIPHRTGDGSIVWDGFAADISARKHDEEHLRQAAAVFETTHEGVMVTDAEQRVLMVNRAFCQISGYDEPEVLGRTPALLSSGRHTRQFYQAMWAGIHTQGHWQGEIWNRRKNGEIYPQLLSISTVRDSGGRDINYVAVFTDISQIKDYEARLEHLAHHDPLTQLPNRLLFQSRLEQSIGHAHRSHGRLALLMLDLDRFKDVNDSFGHMAGDELLQQVATQLQARLREVDTVARLGGDEFAVIMENLAAPEDAAHVANEIIASLSHPWKLSNGIEVHLGASVGISIYPDHAQTAKELLQHADTALYQVKASGRGRFRYFSEDLTRAARDRLEIELGLQRALAQDELRVHFQPQIDIASGRLAGAEALVRWQHPSEGLIPPGRFIPVAEATGLIGPLGAWVLRETCRQGRRWIDAGLPRVRLAVNLSPREFQQGDIERTVAQALDDSGYPPHLLELELTESALMECDDDAVQLLDRLRSLGVRLAIDDFGTGYSSLAYLMSFPLDVLKIDKRFIDDLPHHHDGKEIAATIITMGHSLGFKVLAEGVETPEQLDFLRQHGCDLYQGYLASRPLPADAFERLLAAQKPA